MRWTGPDSSRLICGGDSSDPDVLIVPAREGVLNVLRAATVVDVRDQMDLRIRAMTTPEAAGRRFLGTGEFMWMRDIACALRNGLGDQGTRVPTRQPPVAGERPSAKAGC